jgi:pyruvate dehydrogenase E2 component (dihydrolipoamide acetyltransferase)
MEVEAYVDGYLREILTPEGKLACAMSALAIVTDHPDEPYDLPKQAAAPLGALVDSPPAAPLTPAPRAGGVAAAPAAKQLAKELGIDLASVTGTGPGGLITRKDVDQLRAKRMAAMATLVIRSKQTIPHFYLTADINVCAAEQWRENWNVTHPSLPATVNDLLVRAASKALRDVPSLNVSYDDGSYKRKSEADVLLIVAAESGLALVPVADPSRLPWEEYLTQMRRIMEKAVQGRIAQAPSQIRPLLALSNLGMFRVKDFVAIIPPSCTAVLAVGAIRDEAVVCHGRVEIGRLVSLTLSADHRVVDGITAARFMEKIQEHLNSL